jgi:hypothetical protein
MKVELTQAVVACLKRGLNCWPEQNFADGAEIRKILDKDEMLESILSGIKRIEAKQNWVDLTHDEATEIWERIDDRDSWELIMQVQKSLKEKNT